MSVRVISRIKFTAEAPWIQPMINYFASLEPGGIVARRVLQRALIYGVLRSIRRVYMARLHNALTMSIVSTTRTGRRADNFSISERMESLRKAHESMDEAVLSGNQDRIKAAARRLNTVDRAIAQNGLEPDKRLTKLSLKAMSLSALTSALMRDRALQVLDFLTNAQYVKSPVMENGNMSISAGRVDQLDQIKTPSATDALLQRPTDSEYDIMWRQLEFGTGVRASNAKVMGQNIVKGSGTYKNADGSWWYGPPRNATGKPQAGLLVQGNSPMHALWGPSGVTHAQHYIAAQIALNAAMEDLAPRFT
jgi:hypothetical protein